MCIRDSLWPGEVGKSAACRVLPVPPHALRWAPVVELQAVLGVARLPACQRLGFCLPATSVHVPYLHRHWPASGQGPEEWGADSVEPGGAGRPESGLCGVCVVGDTTATEELAMVAVVEALAA